MNLYRISQTTNEGYDTYDSAVVVAASEEDARKIHPGSLRMIDYGEWWTSDQMYSTWGYALEDVKVELIGQAAPKLKAGAVVCASFNAG